MNATDTRNAMRTLDHAYWGAGVALTRNAETWIVRVAGQPLVSVRRSHQWAMDAEAAGVDIKAN